MRTFSVIELGLAVTIIALAGISVVTAASLLAQSASATDVTMNNTTVGGGGAVSSTITNNSNALLVDLFMIVEFETANVNPINETYIETSTVNNVTIMPPNATTGTTINATETVNATVNILPNGLAFDHGQSLIVSEGDEGGAAEQENATTTFVDISRMNPDGTGSGTGVVFFNTNSTGQLAFLDNMVGINQGELSPEGGNIRIWEWKGETLPFETGGGAPITGNQTTMTSALQEEEAVSSTITNKVSNALLGRLFSFGEGEVEDIEANVNPINETYIEVSYSGNRIIVPPNVTGLINATEIGNFTINIQPNGLSINQGQADIMTERDGAAAEEEVEENATITFVLLTRTNPDGSGSGTSVTYFSTNSTGQLAFLNNTVAIGQVEYSPEEGINRFAEWEWKGGTIPFENLLPQS